MVNTLSHEQLLNLPVIKEYLTNDILIKTKTITVQDMLNDFHVVFPTENTFQFKDHDKLPFTFEGLTDFMNTFECYTQDAVAHYKFKYVPKEILIERFQEIIDLLKNSDKSFAEIRNDYGQPLETIQVQSFDDQLLIYYSFDEG